MGSSPRTAPSFDWGHLQYLFTKNGHWFCLSYKLSDRPSMSGLRRLAYVYCPDAVGFCSRLSGKSSNTAAQSSTGGSIAAISYALHQNRALADAPCTKYDFVVLYCGLIFIWYRKELVSPPNRVKGSNYHSAIL